MTPERREKMWRDICATSMGFLIGLYLCRIGWILGTGYLARPPWLLEFAAGVYMMLQLQKIDKECEWHEAHEKRKDDDFD